jgi:hypothetical protein
MRKVRKGMLEATEKLAVNPEINPSVSIKPEIVLLGLRVI